MSDAHADVATDLLVNIKDAAFVALSYADLTALAVAANAVLVLFVAEDNFVTP